METMGCIFLPRENHQFFPPTCLFFRRRRSTLFCLHGKICTFSKIFFCEKHLHHHLPVGSLVFLLLVRALLGSLLLLLPPMFSRLLFLFVILPSRNVNFPRISSPAACENIVSIMILEGEKQQRVLTSPDPPSSNSQDPPPSSSSSSSSSSSNSSSLPSPSSSPSSSSSSSSSSVYSLGFQNFWTMTGVVFKTTSRRTTNTCVYSRQSLGKKAICCQSHIWKYFPFIGNVVLKEIYEKQCRPISD